MSRRIDIHIDELYVADLRGRPEAIAGEIQLELRRLLEDRGLPATTGTHIDRVVTPPAGSDTGSGPGVEVARAVYERMRSDATDTT